MRTKLRYIALVLCLALGLSGCGEKVYVPVVRVDSLTAAALAGDQFAGMVVSDSSVTVTSESGKKVKELLVKEGDKVTLGQKLFGVGTVTLYCSDKSSGVFELQNVKKPEQVRRFLSDLVEKKRTESGVKGREIYGSGNPMPPHPGHDADCDCGAPDME